jgi:DNA-binding GntR family transcriptional regulator
MREEAYRQLRELIVAGTLQPGERLRDDELAAWLGVSRTPVREGLARLVDDGLVEMAANRFTRVTELRASDAADDYPIRAQLEALAAADAADHIGPAALAEMGEAADRFTWATWREDAAEALMAEALLHERLIGASPNRQLGAMLDRLSARLRRLEQHVWPAIAASWPADAHRRLISALEQHSPADAAAAVGAEWRSVEGLVAGALHDRGLE